jgi:cytochrome c oxidase accessory protein FixG
VFRRIERWFEGSATKRRQLDGAGFSFEKYARRTGKYLSYAAVALVLAHTLLGYFMPVRDVVAAMTGPPSAHPTAFVFVMAPTAVIYLNFAWFREQLCIVICPYGRLQAVLYDKDTVNVGYDKKRGEPRGKHDVAGGGDCIDCQRCIAVCPTGIDIRNGTQLECVGCANCVDACDEVMDKVGQSRGLVRYDSQRGFEDGQRRFIRARVFLYAVLLLLGVTVFAFAATRRTTFEANLVRVQGPPYVLEGDLVTNAFTIHLVNKAPAAVTFTLVPDASDEAAHALQWTIPVATVTLASLADQRLPVVVKFARGTVVARARLSVSAGQEQRFVDVRLLAP